MPLAETRARSLIAALVFCAFLLAFFNTAWVSEDAVITFRAIDNWLGGNGLRWNVDERVQVFTHPLWMLLLTPLVGISKDPYWSAIALSAISLAGFVLVAFRTLGGVRASSVLALLSVLWCRSFVDYSSSGLENPMTHLLLASFLLAFGHKGPQRLLLLFGLAGLLYLNRPDAVVLIVPALLVALVQAWRESANGTEKRQALLRILIALAPAIAWTAFSIFYYGSPVPNTAIAKVQTGLTFAQRAEQAWSLVAFSARHDAPTLMVIAAGLLAGCRVAALRPVAAGGVLWFAYLVYVGGDYMGGRFFSGVLVICALMLGTAEWSRRALLAWCAALILLSPALRWTVFSPQDYQEATIAASGIADERGFYYADLGLRPTLRRGTWHVGSLLAAGNEARETPDEFYVACNVGMFPYAAGPHVRVIDPLALTDAFLARLPSRRDARVGHYERAFPSGYLASWQTGTNQLTEPALRNLWDDLNLATRANLFATGRLEAIWRLNMGKLRYSPAHFDRDAEACPGFLSSIHPGFLA